MNIVVTGGTGFIGKPLCAELAAQNHAVTILARSKARPGNALPPGVTLVPWNGGVTPEFLNAISSADAVINLAGEPIAAKRWTPEIKQRLRRSRVDTTKDLAEAMVREPKPGRVFLSGSAVGYYGDTGDQIRTEEASPGKDFLADLSVEWEAAARRAEESGARVVLLRTGIVYGHGGALEKMAKPFRFGVGGPLGSGRQWVSWVHIQDVVGMIEWALKTEKIAGPLNLTAPNPVTNRELAQAIGKALHRPAFLPVPGFALRLLVGEFAEALLGGQRVLPQKALGLGYTFRFAEIDAALRDLFGVY